MKKLDHRSLSSFAIALAVAMICNIASAQQPFGATPPTQQAPGAEVQDPLPTTIAPSGERFSSRAIAGQQDREAPSDQPILLNSKFAGWEGAIAENTVDNKRIGDSLRGNWIMLDTNGRFTGQVKPGQDADVSNMNVFLMNMGRLVKQTTVDQQGRFEFTNVRQGAYSLIGWGSNGLFAFGFNILENNPENVDKVANNVQVMAFQNRTSINTDWIRHYSPQVGFRVYGRYPAGEGRDDQNSLYGVLGLYNNLPPSIPATSISSHTVSRTADNRLVGRVHQLNSINGRPVDVRSTKVLLLEGDSVVASTTTDNYGVFEFLDVPNGSYGVLAAGVDGAGLISINVGDTAPGMNADGELNANGDSSLIDFTMLSSETIGWLNHYASEVAYQRGLRAPRPPQNDGQQYGCPTCNNQLGGCNTCQQQYQNSICRSRGLTFEQWQANGCQCQRSGFGDGRFFRETGQQLRRSIEKMDNFYDRVFYPNELGYDGNGGGYNNGYGNGGYNNGYGNGGYNNGYGNGGYNNGYGGYGNGYNNGYFQNGAYPGAPIGPAPVQLAPAQQIAPGVPMGN
ncbi:MAG: hypothetical protein AAFN77_15055 [Planctomycetota bacterium]